MTEQSGILGIIFASVSASNTCIFSISNEISVTLPTSKRVIVGAFITILVELCKPSSLSKFKSPNTWLSVPNSSMCETLIFAFAVYFSASIEICSARSPSTTFFPWNTSACFAFAKKSLGNAILNGASVATNDISSPSTLISALMKFI